MVKGLAGQGDLRQTLLLRDPKKLSGREPANAKVVIGGVLDKPLLKEAMAGQGSSTPTSSGDNLDKQAQAVITAMRPPGEAPGLRAVPWDLRRGARQVRPVESQHHRRGA